jgi:hypothetical protein
MCSKTLIAWGELERANGYRSKVAHFILRLHTLGGSGILSRPCRVEDSGTTATFLKFAIVEVKLYHERCKILLNILHEVHE